MGRRPPTHTVFLTQDAMDDIGVIHDYIYVHDSPERADYVIGQIEKTSTMERRAFKEGWQFWVHRRRGNV